MATHDVFTGGTVRLLALCALLLVTTSACSGSEITRGQWERMDAKQRALSVESLRGHGAAVEAKGGDTRPSHSRPTSDYVAAIDRAYATGDTRSVDALWRSMSAGASPVR